MDKTITDLCIPALYYTQTKVLFHSCSLMIVFFSFQINPSYGSTPDTILNHGNCDSPISPPAPSKIKQFEINSYNVDSEIALNKILVQVHHMNVEWNLSIASDPSISNATSLGYEIWIGSVNNTQDIVSGNVYSLNNITSVNEVIN